MISKQELLERIRILEYLDVEQKKLNIQLEQVLTKANIIEISKQTRPGTLDFVRIIKREEPEEQKEYIGEYFHGLSFQKFTKEDCIDEHDGAIRIRLVDNFILDCPIYIRIWIPKKDIIYYDDIYDKQRKLITDRHYKAKLKRLKKEAKND